VKISAVIIAFNEEEKIADAIRSVDFADEVLVVDSESTDRTREISAKLGAKVIVKPWPGFAKQKQFATDNAKFDRILSLDADERVSDELRRELLAINEVDAADGYRIPRAARYLGREIRHSGWYPDWQLRFFDRSKGRWKDIAIHESVEMDAGSRIARLKGHLEHLTIEHPGQHAEMIRTRYAPMSAQAMHNAGKKGSMLKALVLPPITFLQTYFLKAGILDGTAGLRISYYAAYNVYLKHRLLCEMQRK
jgi:glycosyltransferase involved in cell wall biosynthesis